MPSGLPAQWRGVFHQRDQWPCHLVCLHSRQGLDGDVLLGVENFVVLLQRRIVKQTHRVLCFPILLKLIYSQQHGVRENAATAHVAGPLLIRASSYGHHVPATPHLICEVGDGAGIAAVRQNQDTSSWFRGLHNQSGELLILHQTLLCDLALMIDKTQSLVLCVCFITAKILYASAVPRVLEHEVVI